MPVIVRPGKETDLGRVLDLVKELAHFEKAPDEVEVTLSEMQRWFTQEKIFHFFVLEKNDAVIGIALYYYKYSTWKGKCLFLEDLVVTEAERKNGYGKLLFNEVVKVAKLQQVRRMEWQVLDWNVDAIAFYKKYNAHLDGEWINCKLSFE